MADIIIDKEEDNKNKDNSNNNQINNFETDITKYNFDYTTKFKTCDLNEKEKKQFILNLLLMSSKLNVFNKLVCLNKLYNFNKERGNNQMIFKITHKIMKNLKKMKKIQPQYVDIDGLFSKDFINENNNYNYAFKTLNDIKKIINYNMNHYILYNKIKELIDFKIKSFKATFKDVFDYEHIKCLHKIIDKILNENEKMEEKIIKESLNKNDKNNINDINQLNNNIKDNNEKETGNIIINSNEKDKVNINNIDNNNNDINKIVNSIIIIQDESLTIDNNK